VAGNMRLSGQQNMRTKLLFTYLACFAGNKTNCIHPQNTRRARNGQRVRGLRRGRRALLLRNALERNPVIPLRARVLLHQQDMPPPGEG